MKKKKIYKILADLFQAPCNYTFKDLDTGELDVGEFMAADDKWCLKHCADKRGYDECWKKFLKKLNEKETEDESTNN